MPFRALPIKPRVPIMTTSSHNPAGRASAIDPGAGQIGMAAAVSIGIGGMIGAGIFSILGVVAHAAGSAMWLAFMLGGIVALLSTYSYAKLGAAFPSAGGAVHFLVKGFGDGVLAGGLNLFILLMQAPVLAAALLLLFHRNVLAPPGHGMPLIAPEKINKAGAARKSPQWCC